MTETVSALLPCPFCGEQPELYGASIECVNSDCWGPAIYHFARAPDTVEAWNRRATPSRNDILEAEQVERAAESMCRATYLEWDSLDDKTGTDHLNDDGPETKEWFRYLARAAIRALVKP
jgi:hypothetical protein